MALSPLCSAMQIPAAVSGNLTRLQAPLSARNFQPAKSNRRATIKPTRSSAVDPASTDNNTSLLDEFQNGHRPYRRFPSDFAFGAATSAYQVEGATDIGGKGPSIWDIFCEKYPEKISGGASGNPAAGSYQHYQDDVDHMYDMGMNAYRFSISWPRVLPDGKSNKPNEEGIQYYNRLIDALIAKGIQPYVTLFHWDSPQALEDEYGGFLSRKIIPDFVGYAELCFQRFGDRVKHWITMNEPQSFANVGYAYGSVAPGHCTPDLKMGDIDLGCPVGDSLREPYKVGHNILLAHAEAVKLYRDNYQNQQQGTVGISLNTPWFEPYDLDSALDREAQNRALEFSFGWFMDPLKFGKYPFSMRAMLGDRLDIFTAEESEKLKGSFDFIGLNYYTARYVKDTAYDHTSKALMSPDDMFVELRADGKNGPIGPSQPNSWVIVYPDGLHKLLVYIKDRYSNPPIYVTENGVERRVPTQPARPVEESNNVGSFPLFDYFRIEYLSSHIDSMDTALQSQVDLRGYFVWSLLDSFEWSYGYTARFGLIYVDPKTLKRRPKQSASWLQEILHSTHVLSRAPPPSELANNVLPRVSTVVNKNVVPVPVPVPEPASNVAVVA